MDVSWVRGCNVYAGPLWAGTSSISPGAPRRQSFPPLQDLGTAGSLPLYQQGLVVPVLWLSVCTWGAIPVQATL